MFSEKQSFVSSFSLRRTPKRDKRWIVAFCLFGGVFLLGALIFLIHLFLWGHPYLEQLNYRQTTARVIESKAVPKPSKKKDKNVKYRPEIKIIFQAENEPFDVRTYQFDTLSEEKGFNFSKTSAEKICEHFQPQNEYPCWYNENDPKQAVLVRESGFWGFCFFIIPLSLMFLGGSAVFFLIYRRNFSPERSSWRRSEQTDYWRNTSQHDIFPTVPDETMINESPGVHLAYRLPFLPISLLKMLTAGIVGTIWILLVLIVFAYLLSVRENIWDVVSSFVFLFFFGGCGLFFLKFFLREIQYIAHSGSILLEISDHPIYPDRKYRLYLVHYGSKKLYNYRLILLCLEKFRFRDGNETVSGQKTVFSQILFESDEVVLLPQNPLLQEMFFRVPRGAIHSFRSEHNEILWKIQIEMTTENNIKIVRELPLVVYPVAQSEPIYHEAR